MTDETVLLNDAVKSVMKTTRRNRRQAERFLLQALKLGKLRATGVVESGDRVEIPIEAFSSVPTEP